MSITFRNVSVAYPVLEAVVGSYSLSGKIIGKVGGLIKANSREMRIPTVVALDNINFQLGTGDRLAIIGHNGAGKSTLLKTICGIYPPASGTAEITGRISSLLDLSTGFEADLSGRKNVRQKLRMLGIPRSTIRDVEESIERFCELGSFYDLPIRTYSTGMYIRLSFAIATSLTPDILVLDEMLSAGDAAFIEKAKCRLDDFLAISRIIILASHDLSLLQSVCNKGIVLSGGKQVYCGPIKEAIDLYRSNTY
jgi:ABC-type polysaccharide/polyol phosphate transport system ATPase subunit